jgi:hypothetical protein
MNDPLSQSTRDVVVHFGFNWWVFLSQLFAFAMIVAAIGLPIFTTIYCLRDHRSDSRLPGWLLLTWLVPIAGPLCAFAALKRGRAAERRQ